MKGKLILMEAIGWLTTGSGFYAVFFDKVSIYSYLMLLAGLILILYTFSERKRVKETQNHQ